MNDLAAMNQDSKIKEQQQKARDWFLKLRDLITNEFMKIEEEYADKTGAEAGKFKITKWDRPQGGGGEMGLMKGLVFEKVGVNFSEVQGEFSETFRKEIPGADQKPQFWASGISLVAHMHSPLVPAVHMNTRFICTSKTWFGGGADLTPMFEDKEDTRLFHKAFQAACDKHNPEYYPNFKKQCDEYFYLKHRNEPRGIGGIFYDYHNSGSFDDDFALTQDVGKAFLEVYAKIVRKNMYREWTEEQREYQLVKRGRYVEFNLLYDRGTKFGLMTDGNVDAILMSMPPVVKWP